MAGTYRPSGKFPLPGIVLTVLGSALAGAALGVLYVLAARLNPVIYLTFLLTAAWGLLAGLGAGFFVRLARIRSPLAAQAAAAAGALAGWYCSWALFTCLFFGPAAAQAVWTEGGELSFPKAQVTLSEAARKAAQPLAVLGDAKRICASGSFSVWRFGRASGLPLLAVWILEFFIYIRPVVRAAGRRARAPYFEDGGAWLKKARLKQARVRMPDLILQMERVYADARNGRTEYFLLAPKHPSRTPPYISFSVMTASGCPWACLSAAARESRELKVGTKPMVREIARNSLITSEEAEAVIQRFSASEKKPG
jgi:hypothetical protein